VAAVIKVVQCSLFF